MIIRCRTLAAALLCTTAPLAAQGTVGGQGFGYPVAQQGGRVAGTAGALSAFDPVAPSNPAALAEWERHVLFFHYEPEFRTSRAGDASASTRVARFPLAGAATRIGSRLSAGVAFSTYLDRTWETASTSTDRIGDRDVELTTRYASNGAINDLRAGAAWRFSDGLRLGAAYHAYTGENRLSIGWDFPDGEPFGDVNQESTLSYTGSAVSVGIDARPASQWAVAAYYRAGGAARLRANDTLVTEGDMPNHAGAAVRYSGIPGTVLAAGWERVEWSALRALGNGTLGARDGDRLSAGVESRGPTVGGAPMTLRLGVAQRTLPFDVAQDRVREFLVAGGFGYTLGSGLGSLDLALQRASRSAGDVRETAWLLSLGITISP